MTMDNNVTLTKKIYAEDGSNVSICIEIYNVKEDTGNRIKRKAEYFAGLVSKMLEGDDQKENLEEITLGSGVCHELKSFDEHQIGKAMVQGFVEAFLQDTKGKKITPELSEDTTNKNNGGLT